MAEKFCIVLYLIKTIKKNLSEKVRIKKWSELPGQVSGSANLGLCFQMSLKEMREEQKTILIRVSISQ